MRDIKPLCPFCAGGAGKEQTECAARFVRAACVTENVVASVHAGSRVVCSVSVYVACAGLMPTL